MSTRIDIVAAMHDGLGFAAGRFSEVLRISWFPLLALYLFGLATYYVISPSLNWQSPAAPLILGAIYLPVSLILNVTVMVALIRMAVTGAPPHHRSIHFAFGPREVLFVLASVLSLFFVLVLSFAPAAYLSVLIDGFARQQETQTAFFFTEGSLHEGGENLLYADGHPVRRWEPVVVTGMWVVLGYLALRLFMLPVMVAARSRTPFRSTWRASAGFNIVRILLLAIVALLVLIAAEVSASFVADIGMTVAQLLGTATWTAESWGLGFALPGWANPAQFVVATAVSGIFALVTQAFAMGLLAGFSGALAKQVDG